VEPAPEPAPGPVEREPEHAQDRETTPKRATAGHEPEPTRDRKPTPVEREPEPTQDREPTPKRATAEHEPEPTRDRERRPALVLSVSRGRPAPVAQAGAGAAGWKEAAGSGRRRCDGGGRAGGCASDRWEEGP